MSRERRTPRYWQPTRADVARDVDDELRSHLELRADEYMAQGLTPEEARSAAERRFGDAARISTACRRIDEAKLHSERRQGGWTDLRQDVRYALRLLRRAPSFTTVAVLTLAFGIGATTSMFSLANWALLRPLPGVVAPDNVRPAVFGTQGRHSFNVARISPEAALALDRELTSADFAGYQFASVVVARDNGDLARGVRAAAIAPSYFDLLGTRLTLGRAFTTAEDRSASPRNVAIISHSLWTSLFDRDPAVLGRTVRVSNVPLTIVGVTEAGFAGAMRLGSIDIYFPGAMYAEVRHWDEAFRRNPGFSYTQFLLRPASGAHWARVEDEAALVLAGWSKVDSAPSSAGAVRPTAVHFWPSLGAPPAGLAGMTLLMLAISGLVLLVASVNVASLMLMRGVARSSEAAVRRALGAGRFRLVRQHLVEGLCLWIAGCGVALGGVWLVNRGLDGGNLVGSPIPLGSVPIDWRVAAFAVCLSLVVGTVSTLIPAIRATGHDPATLLRLGAPGTAPRRRTASALVVVQLAVSVALAAGAMMLALTMRELSRVPLGFDSARLTLVGTTAVRSGYSPERAAAYRQELVHRLAAVQGVVSISGAGNPHFAGGDVRARLRNEATGEMLAMQRIEQVRSGYFETLRLPLLAGRTFVPADAGAAVVILSRRAAMSVFGTLDIVGKSVRQASEPALVEVVGVVEDSRNQAVDEPLAAIADYPEVDLVSRDQYLVVRTVDDWPLHAEVRAAARAIDPAVPAGDVISYRSVLASARSQWEAPARAMIVLAAIAAALAAVGLYGVMAFGVTASRREYGIRIALGASPSAIVRSVLSRAGLLAGAGLALGTGLSFAMGAALRGMLFGVGPADPRVALGAILCLLVVAAVSSVLPARRALQVDVARTLRSL